jgi:hypothetical protein
VLLITRRRGSSSVVATGAPEQASPEGLSRVA